MSDHQPTYGIIGYPIAHSLSPVMHNTAFQELDVDATYKLFPLKPDDVEEFFTQLRDKNSPIFGLNVTVPYKEIAIKYLDTLAPLVVKIGAVNTIVISEDRKLSGFNTDAPGFLAHLQELKFNTAGKTIAILGAGGSMRAILTALCLIPERPHIIRVYNRTKSKAEEMIKQLSERVNLGIVHLVDEINELELQETDLLINTTSVGLKKEDPLLIDPSLLHKKMFVYDLIYNPAETPLLKAARERGARTSNGLGMLFYQGILAFRHWAKTELSDTMKSKIRKALEDALKEKGH